MLFSKLQLNSKSNSNFDTKLYANTENYKYERSALVSGAKSSDSQQDHNEEYKTYLSEDLVDLISHLSKPQYPEMTPAQKKKCRLFCVIPAVDSQRDNVKEQ